MYVTVVITERFNSMRKTNLQERINRVAAASLDDLLQEFGDCENLYLENNGYYRSGDLYFCYNDFIALWKTDSVEELEDRITQTFETNGLFECFSFDITDIVEE